MTIKVYPSLMPGGPIEEHAYSGSIGDWLRSVGIDFEGLEKQPVEVSIEGRAIPAREWNDTVIGDRDVDVRVVPHGGAFSSIMNFIRKTDPILNWVMKSMTPKLNNNEQQSGSKLETVNATANEAKFGSVVPELAGRFIRHPEYLIPPRRYFENMRLQWVKFLGCVGPGTYSIDPADVKIGDTPFSSLGDDGIFVVYPPGTDLSGEQAAEHWHTVSEVGGTSSGTAGLVLSTDVANRTNTDPTSYAFDWDDITRSEGEWPTGWGAGTVVRVQYPRPYEVVTINVPPTESAAGYSISEITGYFLHLPNPLLADGQAIGVGPFGAVVQYQIRTIVEVGGGVYTLRLEELTGDPVVLPPGPAQVLYVGSDLNRSITFASGNMITVTPGRFETGSSVASVAFEGGEVYGEWSSEFVATPGNETTNFVEFDVFLPSGLVDFDGGDMEPRTVRIEFQYRDIGGGPTTTASYAYTQATLDEIGFTERLPIPRIRPACRMRRVSSESTNTNIQDKIHWYGLKSRIDTTPFVYPNWTTIAVALRSGGRIAAQSENQINLVAVRELPELQADGSWGPPVPTRHISASFRHILHSIGYNDDQIDIAELQRLNDVWNLRGETLDYVFDETTVKQALDLALAAGMAELTVADGLAKPVRDDVRTQFEQGYSPQNMTGPLRRAFRGRRPGDPDGIEVEYTDEQTWTKQVVRCLLDFDQGFKVQKVKLDGVTDRTRAWRIGMRQRREMFFRNWEYSFSTELDALNSEYLSYVPLVDDIPGYGKSAILEHIEPSGGQALLHVSEPMQWTEGANHVVAYRRLDGTIAGPFTTQPGPDDYTILADIPTPWPVINLKAEPPHVYFGTAEEWCFPALITEIRPDGQGGASVSAVNYHPAVYDDDNAIPPT